MKKQQFMQRRNKMIAWILLLVYILASALGMVFIKKGELTQVLHSKKTKSKYKYLG